MNAFIRSANTVIMSRSIATPAVESQPGAAEARGFELVVIGGSAGGIEVLNVLLGALPASFAPAVIHPIGACGHQKAYSALGRLPR